MQTCIELHLTYVWICMHVSKLTPGLKIHVPEQNPSA